MNYEISTKEKSTTKELNDFFSLAIKIITFALLCNQVGICKLNEQGQLIFPFIAQNAEILIGSFIVTFLLVNGILLLKRYFNSEQYDWHLFAIDCFTFSIPFLLSASFILLFSNPVGGIELLAAILSSGLIGYLFYSTIKLAIYRIKKII